MANLPYMLKHRGFPSRLAGTDHQFTIRRAATKGITPLVARERFRDRRTSDRQADDAFLSALLKHFETNPFERGNLDAGRLNWLFEREVLKAEDAFDNKSYEAMLRIDIDAVRRNFPQVLAQAGI